MLVAKCDRTPDQAFAISDQYRQDLDVGMLGATLARGECLRTENVLETPPPYGYLRMENFPAKSALCYPIKVAGKVDGFLDFKRGRRRISWTRPRSFSTSSSKVWSLSCFSGSSIYCPRPCFKCCRRRLS